MQGFERFFERLIKFNFKLARNKAHLGAKETRGDSCGFGKDAYPNQYNAATVPAEWAQVLPQVFTKNGGFNKTLE